MVLELIRLGIDLLFCGRGFNENTATGSSENCSACLQQPGGRRLHVHSVLPHLL
jgi:hypothetical protein